ncbi:hypothetical protein D1007_41199 [Hordeum vulgare]|nr:hypothetical protein D1007_41199 [Hordeum vulgare]
MVEKVLGLPHGTRPVVVISKHEESPHREFYKTYYDHGRRAPIHYAATILEKEADLDDETFFRTFFIVALATHLTPGTGNMVPLEYLGSLEVASEELPTFLLQIIERHKAKWAQDISKATSRLSKLHAKRMEEFAQDVLAATKDNAPDPTNYSSPHWILQDTHTEQPQPPGPKETPDTKFWKEATAYADEVEKSVTKKSQNNQDVASTSAPSANQVCTEPRPSLHQDQPADAVTTPPVTKHSTSDEETLRRVLDSYEDPSFSLLPPGQTWTQAFAEPPPSTHEGEIVDASTAVVQTTATGPTTMATVEANLAHISHESSPIHAPTPTSPTQLTQGGQPTTGDVLHTIGTQTQEKKNRKKRACLRKTEDTRLKKIKVTSSSIELYNKYITARCLRPPKKTDKRPPFIDYGGYHISYEHFRDALKPRGWVDTHTMELYIREFNLQQTMEACSSALPTKYAFSQSLTAKLSVPEDKFVATNSFVNSTMPTKMARSSQRIWYTSHAIKHCAHHFISIFPNFQFATYHLYFAIPHKQHWILCCINLLYKQINIFDSDKKLKNDEVYELSNNLVTNFTTLAAHAKAFTKLDFMKFTCFNPPDCPQQKTQ